MWRLLTTMRDARTPYSGCTLCIAAASSDASLSSSTVVMPS